MSTERVDFLFRGSHPAFCWAAALLKQKGKNVAILPEPEGHSWEIFPVEVLSLLGLHPLKTDRDQSPIQILTKERRLGIFADLTLTQKDYQFCAGVGPAPELARGLSFYAKGSDYPVVFRETDAQLIEACHHMEYFEQSPREIEIQVLSHLKKMGVIILKDENNLPLAEQTVVLDFKRARLFRTKFEIAVPLKNLPVGASNRMLFVERNSPLIEMIYQNESLHLRTLLPEEPLLIERMLNTVKNYFPDQHWSASEAKVIPPGVAHSEWIEAKSNVDSSKLGLWLMSPAINHELGERSLYVRLSELLTKKFKKEQVFEVKELFMS